MRIPRIYTSCILEVNQSIELEPKAHKHLKDVLRKSAGDQVILFNGDGHDYCATIDEISKRVLLVNVNSSDKINNESLLELHLLQPLCGSEKMDLCIQKATELGVSTITPFYSSRVNINIANNRLDKKMHHWQSVIQSACEQSSRSHIPEIYKPIDFDHAINNFSQSDIIKLIASPTAVNSIPLDTTKYQNCVCAIGPEGGFTQPEIAYAEQLGFNTIKIGPRTLRLETAVIAAMTLCQFKYGDFD